IGHQLTREGYGLLAVARLADHAHIAVRLDDLAQGDPHKAEIVDHQDAQRAHRGGWGGRCHYPVSHSRSGAMMRNIPPPGEPAIPPASSVRGSTISLCGPTMRSIAAIDTAKACLAAAKAR